MIGLFMALALAGDPPRSPPKPMPPPAPPAQSHPKVITQPDWLALPSGDDMASHYPQEAKEQGIEGRAVIDCAVTVEGTLNDCEIQSETPEAKGFGPATVEIAASFRMRPQTVDGKPAGGGRVVVPVQWKLSEGTDEDGDVGYLTARPSQLVAPSERRAYSTWLYGEAREADGVVNGGACDSPRVTSRGPVLALAANQLLKSAQPEPASAWVEPVEVDGCGRAGVRLLMVWRVGPGEWRSLDDPQARALVPADQLVAKPESVKPGEDIGEPAWLKTPTQADRDGAYPAAAKGQGGGAAIDCAVTDDGALADCKVTAETPEGSGFGEAALRLAAQYRMKPISSGGKLVRGGRVELKVFWLR
jgi:TonB family protein